MNKTQQIAELKDALHAEQVENRVKYATIATLKRNLEVESELVTALTEQANAEEKRHAKQIAAKDALDDARKKAAREEATLKSIRDGFVPIETLRGLTSQDYSTQHNATRTMTSLTVNLASAKPIDKAILDALLAPEKPKYAKYATGGLITQAPSPDYGNDWGATADYTISKAQAEKAGLAPFAPFKVGDKVDVYPAGTSGDFYVRAIA